MRSFERTRGSGAGLVDEEGGPGLEDDAHEDPAADHAQGWRQGELGTAAGQSHDRGSPGWSPGWPGIEVVEVGEDERRAGRLAQSGLDLARSSGGEGVRFSGRALSGSATGCASRVRSARRPGFDAWVEARSDSMDETGRASQENDDGDDDSFGDFSAVSLADSLLLLVPGRLPPPALVAHLACPRTPSLPPFSLWLPWLPSGGGGPSKKYSRKVTKRVEKIKMTRTFKIIDIFCLDS